MPQAVTIQDTNAHARVQRVLEDVGSRVLASESHGMLCGMVSGPESADRARWIARVLEGTEPSGAPARACLETLVWLFDETLREMEDENFGFHLLLPAEDEPLTARAMALGLWCQGFLYGIGTAGLGKDSKLLPEVGEALSDLSEIAQIEFQVDGGEADEQAYAEVVEYVRMASLLLMETLRPMDKGSQTLQ